MNSFYWALRDLTEEFQRFSRREQRVVQGLFNLGGGFFLRGALDGLRRKDCYLYDAEQKLKDPVGIKRVFCFE